MTDPVVMTLLAMQRQNWEQGVAVHALLDLGHTDLAARLSRDAIVHQQPDGRLGTIGSERGAVNSASLYQGVVLLDPAAAARQLDWIVAGAPRASDGTLYHVLDAPEVWADSVYMVVPMLALAGRPDLAVQQAFGHRARLCRDGLYLAADTRPSRWGTGSGWVAAGLARAVHHVPDLASDLAGHAREVIDACISYRREDGLFGDVLDDPGSFREANLAQMLAYAAYTGVADGWLPSSYRSLADSLVAAVEPYVVDGVVTSVCGAPTFDRPGTSAEAQAFHLMARAAAAR
ncbi:glycoside hydrolase family 88 protein [Dactylosporangium sp. CS-033363]|uniref:glycoside hydrolase family 88 protein n=1 Tax=Dactylosporangium sp. CS-033363 TaxID=3239935 RepID=UPI003D93E3AE